MLLKKEDISFFEKECRKWIARFGLYEYEFFFSSDQDEDTMAKVTNDYPSKYCYINISPKNNLKQAKKTFLKEIALHEILHVLFFPMWRMGHSRNWDEEDFAAIEHSAINRIMRILGISR